MDPQIKLLTDNKCFYLERVLTLDEQTKIPLSSLVQSTDNSHILCWTVSRVKLTKMDCVLLTIVETLN